tara:strand:+ start:189 stop:1235 length:1047 start_codon:yes stop_codon:yes gene_type:complete
MELLTQLLSIPSPTGSEDQKLAFIRNWIQSQCPKSELLCHTVDGLIVKNSVNQGPHIALVGHADVIPNWFDPYDCDGKRYGAGASDMQAGLAALMTAMAMLQKDISVSLIVYNREENTPLLNNGLYGLRQTVPDYFNAIDFAIVAEPTNNTIQLGCVGSVHYTVTVPGVAAHSARPWDGDHALYKALPLIQALANQSPVSHTVMGVDFFDVMHITESQCATGKTTIPDAWQANINYRYAPVYSAYDAENYGRSWIQNWVPTATIDVADHAPAGKLLKSSICDTFVALTGVSVEAKQAWTDVAQFAAMNIPAINYGPGLTAQAHRPDEYVVLSDIDIYTRILTQSLRAI